MINKKISEIAGRFNIEGKIKTFVSYGSGHINETILLTCKTGQSQNRYILRRINRFVFKEPEIVIENTLMVLNHIKSRLITTGLEKRVEKMPALIPTVDGRYFMRDADGEVWSMMTFCEGTYSIDVVEDADQAYQSAKAFGEFQKLIIDADLEKFKPTIRDFHNTSKRVKELSRIIEMDSAKRSASAKEEIEAALDYKALADEMEKLLNKSIPARLTHNDTKINNVLFDSETGEAVCVIDLDTVMPGTVLYDFGDMVRSSTCLAAEDEKDLSKVFVNLQIFEALAKGYLEELKNDLTEKEIENLVFGASVIVYEQAIRFLADYLSGDKYYKTKYPQHNLDRAKNQFSLLKSVLLQSERMNKIVKEVIKS